MDSSLLSFWRSCFVACLTGGAALYFNFRLYRSQWKQRYQVDDVILNEGDFKTADKKSSKQYLIRGRVSNNSSFRSLYSDNQLVYSHFENEIVAPHRQNRLVKGSQKTIKFDLELSKAKGGLFESSKLLMGVSSNENVNYLTPKTLKEEVIFGRMQPSLNFGRFFRKIFRFGRSFRRGAIDEDDTADISSVVREQDFTSKSSLREVGILLDSEVFVLGKFAWNAMLGDYQFLPVAFSDVEFRDAWALAGKIPVIYPVFAAILTLFGTLSLYALGSQWKKKRARKKNNLSTLADSLDYTLTCTNCTDHVSEVICFPCEHISLCHDCIGASTCGYCHARIERTQRIYIS